jgi:hypothetical protein
MTMWNPNQPVYVPRVFRGDLTKEARRGAGLAGAVGFGMLSLGWMTIVLSLTLAFTVSPILLPLMLVGAGLMFASFFVARRILGATHVVRPTGVMVLGTVVALVASWIVGAAVGGTAWLVTLGVPDASRWIVAAVAFGIVLVADVLAGLLGWRWIARVLRPVAIV